MVAFFCTRYFRLRGGGFTKDYEVEEYDLLSLTPHQKQGWGKLIDLNNKHNGGISGDYVISLMENYMKAELDGMTCKVLRVYKRMTAATTIIIITTTTIAITTITITIIVIIIVIIIITVKQINKHRDHRNI